MTKETMGEILFKWLDALNTKQREEGPAAVVSVSDMLICLDEISISYDRDLAPEIKRLDAVRKAIARHVVTVAGKLGSSSSLSVIEAMDMVTELDGRAGRKSVEILTEHAARTPPKGEQHWGSKPEPPKIPSADQRGLSRARSMG